MSEFNEAVQLAKAVLAPDAESSVPMSLLAREFLRQVERNGLRKMFPIQRSTPISWHLAQRAYDTYARCFGTGQSLERLAERGGFGLREFACLFAGHDPYHCPTGDGKECIEKADAVGRRIATLEVAVAKYQADLYAQLDPGLDLIHANRDEILRKHEEAIRRIAAVAQEGKIDLVMPIIKALWAFHPMHEWSGWPEGSEA